MAGGVWVCDGGMEVVEGGKGTVDKVKMGGSGLGADLRDI